ncbi:DUF3558 domain-containing protein [Amycolatopsis xylanica]|uniref:DUF3558 domain-containing protein n=1 Tax=Amycolatopsis xylanica TaxID=589385 RepID=UPI000B88920C|nr:DUF3558 domain-containing protein [Amycolatopsis xylanica]
MFTRKGFIQTAAALTALAMLTGCSAKEPGTASPTPNQPGSSAASPNQPSTSNGTDLSGAPPVKTPLNAAKFYADPCLTLTQAQLQSFNVSSNPRRLDSDHGVGCAWNFGADGGVSAGVNFPKPEKGLSLLYANKKDGTYRDGYFDETNVSGYPAIQYDSNDLRPDGDCTVAVGISDNLYLSVILQGPPGSDGCKRAMNVAKDVIATIQGGQ